MMKKILHLTALLLASGTIACAQTIVGQVNLNFYFGVLSDGAGTVVPDGSFLQIIASTDGSSLAAPTAADFLGGDNNAVVLWQGAFDSTTTGQAGLAAISLTGLNIYADGTAGNYVTAGDPVFVRWFPELTPTDSTPGATVYGQYGYDAIDGTTLDSTWVLPAAGGVGADYFFLTVSAGGTLPDSAGEAAINVATAVPEASTTAALLGAAALLLCCVVRANRARCVCRS